MSKFARRLAQAAGATVLAAGLVAAGGQAGGAATVPRFVPAITPAQQLAGSTSGVDPRICNDWGDGNCIQEHGQDLQVTLQGGATTQFTLVYRGSVTSSGGWPFTGGGTRYNSLYNGRPVYWLQDSSGECLQASAFLAGVEVVPDPSCVNNPWAKWTTVGNWWINIGESDQNYGWYPYSAVMQSGCTSVGCRVWVVKSAPSNSATNAWGLR